MSKKAIILSSVAVLALAGAYAYLKRPKFHIQVKEDGSGSARLGKNEMSFSSIEGVHLKTWNGFTLDANKDQYAFRQHGKNIESGKITIYAKGSSNGTIDSLYKNPLYDATIKM